MESVAAASLSHAGDLCLRLQSNARPRVTGPLSCRRRLSCHAASAAGLHVGSIDKAIAQLHFRLEEYAKAVEDVLVALKHNPKDKDLYLLLGDAYDQLGLRKKGALARIKALQLEEVVGMACSMRALRDAREALEHLRCAEAISIATAALDKPEACPSPTLQAELYRVISDAHSLTGHVVEAVEAERIAVEACPEDVLSRVLLAEKEMELAASQHDLNQVVQLATQGVYMCREFNNKEVLHKFHRSRGRAFFSEGKIEAALRDFEEYHRLRPDMAEPYLLLSDTYDVLGRTQASVEAQEKAVKLDPDNERAKVVLARRLAKLLQVRS